MADTKDIQWHGTTRTQVDENGDEYVVEYDLSRDGEDCTDSTTAMFYAAAAEGGLNSAPTCSRDSGPHALTHSRICCSNRTYCRQPGSGGGDPGHR